MEKLDKRVVKVTLEIGNERVELDGLNLDISVCKTTDSTQSNADIVITNLSHDHRQYILGHTLPRPQSQYGLVKIIVEVGRESYGTSVLFSGEVFKATQTDKPNISLILKCISGYADKTKIVTNPGIDKASFKDISKWIADNSGLSLNFTADDKLVKSYQFVGSAYSQIQHLKDISGLDVFVDKKTLFVKNKNQSIGEDVDIDLSKDSGLIRANATQAGCEIRMMYIPNISSGTGINLKSIMNESLNGQYSVYRVKYTISSRGNDFYIDASCIRRQ